MPVVVSVGLFLFYLFILGRMTAAGISYTFVLNPLVTVVLATLITGNQQDYPGSYC